MAKHDTDDLAPLLFGLMVSLTECVVAMDAVANAVKAITERAIAQDDDGEDHGRDERRVSQGN